jgi:hypothetical protein
MTCVVDPILLVGLCELPCATLSDCPSLYSECTNASCSPVLCGPRFGTSLDAVCNFVGVPGAQGTCVPPDPAMGIPADAGAVGLCSEGGDLDFTSMCSLGASRSSGLDSICPPGLVCGSYAYPYQGASCSYPCNPTDPSSCTGDATCTAIGPGQNPLLGSCGGMTPTACLPLGASCTGYTQCCQAECNAGACACSPAGAPCDVSYECCSGQCGPDPRAGVCQ